MNHKVRINKDQSLSSRPSCRQNVWTDDRQQLKLRKKGSSQDLEDENQLKPSTTSELDDDDIPVIPDLEEIQKEDLAGQTADPPRLINMLTTFEELNTNLGIHAALQTLDGDIDLNVLTRTLCSQEQLHKEDVHWDWDRLFMEVSSELKVAWEKVGKKDKMAGRLNAIGQYGNGKY
uniref:intraflagellar transport protein 43 homolog isoform X2 n=1 Tax=Myxine glutinosa TaxID=7769 RepID=UPI00358EFA83